MLTDEIVEYGDRKYVRRKWRGHNGAYRLIDIEKREKDRAQTKTSNPLKASKKNKS